MKQAFLRNRAAAFLRCGNALRRRAAVFWRRPAMPYRGVTLCLTAALCLGGASLLTACGSSTSGHTPATETTEAPATTSAYLDAPVSNESELYKPQHEYRPVSLSEANYEAFLAALLAEGDTFQYATFYGLEEALQLYQDTQPQTVPASNLLDAAGNLDANALLAAVKANNAREMAGGKNALNAFYTETDEADQVKICSLIAEVVNTVCSPSERQQLAGVLATMTLFNRNGSPSNAYITSHLTFVYNPTMSQMYAHGQQIAGDDSAEDVLQLVLVHEIMHLIQHKNDDLCDENGIEIAICRDYQTDSNTPAAPVNSLWNTWLLEAAAEMRAAEYLRIDTHTYDKKISYVNSYNLSRFHQLQTRTDLLEAAVYNDTLEDLYAQLSLDTPEQQTEFLKFLYSVEITQTDPEDFWAQYTALTGDTPTDAEKLAIRLAIRCEIVTYLTRSFYANLAQALHEQYVTDLDTVFYLMRLWEIDVHGHLEYTKHAYLDAARSFLPWHDQVQGQLFEALAASAGTTAAELRAQYQAYCMQTELDPTSASGIVDNCDLTKYPAFTQQYLAELKADYITTRFVRNSDMLAYLAQNVSPSQH